MLMNLMLTITDRLEIKVLTEYLNIIRHKKNMRTYVDMLSKGFNIRIPEAVVIKYFDPFNALSPLYKSTENLNVTEVYLMFRTKYYYLVDKDRLILSEYYGLTTKDAVDILRQISLEEIKQEDVLRETKSLNALRIKHLKKVIKVRGGYL